MKKIEAIIRRSRFEYVRLALEEAGCHGISVIEIQGYGQQQVITKELRGEDYKITLLPKMKLEIIVKDKDADKIIKTIIENAKSGEIGDGKIFVSDINEAIKIRTGEKGVDVV